MKLSLTILLFAACFAGYGQNVIGVLHNGSTTFYSTLDSAVMVAQNGDNVYIPGGSFALDSPINKAYNLIGVGYNPDSTVATGLTQITHSSITYITSGASNGSMTGIYFYNTNIYFGSNAANQGVVNYSINRCHFNNNSPLTLGSSSPATANNLSFNEDIFDDYVNGQEVQNCFFSKCFFSVFEVFGQGNQFINNIFSSYALSGTYYLLWNITNSTFKNNIFFYNLNNPGNSYSCSGNIFYNNLFAVDTFVLPGTSLNNLFNVSQSKIFVNAAGLLASPYLYSYTDNYALISTSPGKNYGTDGTDVGIFGTTAPFKQGGVPYNPHIQFSSIPTTTSQGTLNVKITVAAQNN